MGLRIRNLVDPRSHLAIALGILATEAGYRTYFTSAADLVANLWSRHEAAPTVIDAMQMHLQGR